MSVRELFQLSMENQEVGPVDDSVEQPYFEGFEPERNVIIHGNVQSGEWESILQESYKEFRLWNIPGKGVEIPSLETLQFQELAEELAENMVNDAIQVFVLPEEDPGLAIQSQLLTAAMNNPDNSVVVSKRPGDHNVTELRSKGVAVVASMEDAALYIATAC